MAPDSSTLAWKITWTEEPCRLQSMGSLRVGHDWVTSLSLSLSCIGEGNGNPLQCSCLENPRDGGAWWASVYGVAQSRTRLKRLSSFKRGLCIIFTARLSKLWECIHIMWVHWLFICLDSRSYFVPTLCQVLSSALRIAAAAAAKSLQSGPTLCDPIDGSPPGSPVPGILQARTLEWVAISFSNAGKWKVKVKSLSCVQLFDPMDCSLPGCYVRGIFQARVLDWGAIAFSGGG